MDVIVWRIDCLPHFPVSSKQESGEAGFFFVECPFACLQVIESCWRALDRGTCATRFVTNRPLFGGGDVTLLWYSATPTATTAHLCFDRTTLNTGHSTTLVTAHSEARNENNKRHTCSVAGWILTHLLDPDLTSRVSPSLFCLLIATHNPRLLRAGVLDWHFAGHTAAQRTHALSLEPRRQSRMRAHLDPLFCRSSVCLIILVYYRHLYTLLIGDTNNNMLVGAKSPAIKHRCKRSRCNSC